MENEVIVIVGRSGTGKTFRLMEFTQENYAWFLHADELLDLIVQCARTENLEQKDLSSRLLESGATSFAFDDIDYGLRGKPNSQVCFCEAMSTLLASGCRIAISCIDLDEVPKIKEFLSSSKMTGCVKIEMLYDRSKHL